MILQVGLVNCWLRSEISINSTKIIFSHVLLLVSSPQCSLTWQLRNIRLNCKFRFNIIQDSPFEMGPEDTNNNSKVTSSSFREWLRVVALSLYCQFPESSRTAETALQLHTTSTRLSLVTRTLSNSSSVLFFGNIQPPFRFHLFTVRQPATEFPLNIQIRLLFQVQFVA